MLGVYESDCSPWMERGLVLLLVLLPQAVLALAVQPTVLGVVSLIGDAVGVGTGGSASGTGGGNAASWVPETNSSIALPSGLLFLLLLLTLP